MKKLLFVIGTRPEAIKMIPLIKKLQSHKKYLVKICNTGQHKEMIKPVLDFFEIIPDFELNTMVPNQTPTTTVSNTILKISEVFQKYDPDYILVEGDTSTVLAASIAAFYKKIGIIHIEAGLRSGDKYSPFPEEVNRILVSHLADYHFAPTNQAKQNLANEGIRKNVYVVGNTVVDALLYCITTLVNKEGSNSIFDGIDFSKKIILVTAHRRENFGNGLKNIMESLVSLVDKYPEIEIVYPVHLNPEVRSMAREILSGIKRIHLLEPLDYPQLVWLMSKSYFILTDSGGIQEEAPTLKKPILILRELTERQEVVKLGMAKLVGTNKEKIIRESSLLIENSGRYNAMTKGKNPYGTGNASKKIIRILDKCLL